MVSALTTLLNQIEHLKAEVAALKKIERAEPAIVKYEPVDYEFEIIRKDPLAQFSQIKRVYARAVPRKTN